MTTLGPYLREERRTEQVREEVHSHTPLSKQPKAAWTPKVVTGESGARSGGVDLGGGVHHPLAAMRSRLSELAAYQAVKATGAEPDKVALLHSRGLLEERGQLLLDLGVVTAGASLETIRDRASALAKTHGRRVGEIIAELDNYPSKPKSKGVLRQPRAANARIHSLHLIDRIRNELLDSLSPIQRAGDPDYAATVMTRIEAMSQALSPLGPILTFRQMEDLKRTVADQVPWTTPDKKLSSSERALKDIWRILDGEFDKRAATMCRLIDGAGGEDPLYDKFLESRRIYGHMIDTKSTAKAKLAAVHDARYLNASDVALGVVGAGLAFLLTPHHPQAPIAGFGIGSGAKSAVKRLQGRAPQMLAAGIYRSGLYEPPELRPNRPREAPSAPPSALGSDGNQ